LTNSGKGNFVLASSPSVLGGPECLAVADINADGKPDLVVGTVYGSIYVDTGLVVLTNDGAGNFIAVTKLHAAGPAAVVVGDLDDDGKADLISAEEALNRAAIFFQVPQLNIFGGPDQVRVWWPSSWTNWAFQESTGFSTANWVLGNDVIDDGTNRTIYVSVSSTNHFFRLLPPSSQ
jgi:hypothetical protein